MIIDQKDFEEIKKELVAFEQEREKQIQLSREIITLSKRIIYSVHRDDLRLAEVLTDDIRKKLKELSKKKLDTGMDKVALQEYVEAIAFLEFVKKGTLVTRKQLGVDTEVYLLGICDLTGELMRKAVKTVIKKEYEKTEQIKELVEEIFGEFLKFDLRNSELRKKADSLKWNLTKIEDLIYDIHIKDKKK